MNCKLFYSLWPFEDGGSVRCLSVVSEVWFGEGMEHPVNRGETMSMGLYDRYCAMYVQLYFSTLPSHLTFT